MSKFLRNKIYLAGPDVFRPDAAHWAETARAICRDYGFIPLTPLDHPENQAEEIFHANLGLIREADLVVANLNPFRGAEPDSGTCFEMGVALALGKTVYGYVAKKDTAAQRVARYQGCPPLQDGDNLLDKNGLLIENFGLPLNLMLAVPATLVEGGLEECIREIHALAICGKI
jgi:nucleoside 2-deoxyribosyltransferase